MAAPRIILETKGISKSFSGVSVLKEVNFKIYEGSVNALMGENGAGKSTLMNIISGVYTDYKGDILLDEKKILFKNTFDAQIAGIAMIHQELNLSPYLSIAENVFLGREPLTRYGTIDFRKMCKMAEKITLQLGLNENVNKKVINLRVGQQQIVEISKAISSNARILIMDEPTSALSDNEVTVLFELINSLKKNGVAIVYITHKMNELFQIADYVTILRDGCVIRESAIRNITSDDVVKSMVGRDLNDFFVKKAHNINYPRIQIKNLTLKFNNKLKLKNISFYASVSEVVGIYGLMGSGRTELLETIFGLHSKNSSGEIIIDNQIASIQNPFDAINYGIALIPEDRKKDGLFLEMDICENINIGSIKNTLKYRVLNKKLQTKQAAFYQNMLNIKASSLKQKVKNLSGGNQQKVVLAKWLATNPKILLLDEPTRGIDINAKNEIYKLINDLADKGLTIIVVSSELPEIMAISDRIITLSEGKITGMFLREQFSEESILKSVLPSN